MFVAKEDLIAQWNATVNAHPQLFDDLEFPILAPTDTDKIEYDSVNDYIEVTIGENNWRLSGQLLRMHRV